MIIQPERLTVLRHLLSAYHRIDAAHWELRHDCAGLVEETGWREVGTVIRRRIYQIRKRVLAAEKVNRLPVTKIPANNAPAEGVHGV